MKSNLIELFTGLEFVFLFLGLFAFVSLYFIFPWFIQYAIKNKLVDEPSDRKVHTTPIPRLGGMLFFGVVLVFCNLYLIPNWSITNFIHLSAVGLIYILGVVDDLENLSAKIKFFFQFVFAIIVIASGLTIGGLHGVLGYERLPYLLDVAITFIVIIGVINAYNLIDGINGLAGSLGVVAMFIFAILFYAAKMYFEVFFAIILLFSLLAFLKYNFVKAKIFMGDAGALALGATIILFSLKLINSNFSICAFPINKVAIVFSLLIIPVYDTFRVFVVRIYAKKSPFDADRTHIHHLLLNAGLRHCHATSILVAFNLFLILIVQMLQDYFSTTLILITLTVATLLFYEIYYWYFYKLYAKSIQRSKDVLNKLTTENYLLRKFTY